MDEYIFYTDRFVSVAVPYVDDSFVSSHHRKIGAGEVGDLINTYKTVSSRNRLLSGLLNELAKVNRTKSIDVLDIGVYMGVFSIGIDLVGRSLGISTNIDAYEANPLLIAAIIKNFRLYETKGNLHWSAIGRAHGSQELIAREGGAIGGSLVNIAKSGNFFSCNVDVLSLSEALQDKPEIGLIKIDIEGYEVPAFSSIYGNKNRLNNVFIVEYSPKQGEQAISEGVSYNDFIMSNFNVFNVGNWAWFNRSHRILDKHGLVNCVLGNGSYNTDLLFLPKGLDLDPNDF
ncbi:MAG: hypothetical protein CRU78_04585 [Candidatus Accumulibacter phosphatis]|jgi:FkbM family methyltransferase|uniref:Methyltransferase FkbM domain-containing protein n=1 Tax=Candidatus Accumulibacter phosphatis TaxID=327160 RepID=A0A6A7RQL0_9PROT|nr:hypothetical protein [Candidatus Accumulibacter phosphatis]